MPSATAHAAAEGVSSWGLAAIIGAAAVLAAIAVIEGGFAEGGYTGGRRRRPVGIVHGEEYVFTAEEVDTLGVPFLQKLADSASGGKGRVTVARAGSIPSSLIQGAEPALPSGGVNAPQIVDFDPGEIEPGNLPGAWAIGANRPYNPYGPVPIPPGFFDPLGPTVEINPGGPVRVPYYDPSAPFDANQLATNWTLSQFDVGPYQFGDRPLPYFGGVPTSGSVVPPGLGGMILIRDDAGNVVGSYTTTDRGTSLTGDDITGGLQIPTHDFSGPIGTVIDASGRPVPVTDVDYFGRPMDAHGNVIPTSPGATITPAATPIYQGGPAGALFPVVTTPYGSSNVWGGGGTPTDIHGNVLPGTSRNYGDTTWATNVHDPNADFGDIVLRGPPPSTVQLRAALAAASVGHGDVHLAGGGRVPGIPSRSDNMLAAIASGEVFISTPKVQAIDRDHPGLLDSLIHYAEGGRVGGGSSGGALGDQPVHVVLVDNRREARALPQIGEGPQVFCASCDENCLTQRPQRSQRICRQSEP
jgi:hypothetical protein